MNKVEIFLEQKNQIAFCTGFCCSYGSGVVDFIQSIGLSLLISIENRFKILKDYKQNKAIKEFSEFYPILIAQIDFIEQEVKSDSPDKRMQAVFLYKELLLTDAEIKVSTISRFLRDPQKFALHKKEKHNALYSGDQSYLSSDLKKFRERLKALKDQIPKIEEPELKRWIDSRSLQRKLPALSQSKILPFKAKDVPAGAILLTNKEVWYKSLKLEYGKRSFIQYVAFSIVKLYKIFSGKGIPHAEIALGDGKFLHQFLKKVSQEDIEKRKLEGITKVGESIILTRIEDRIEPGKKDKILPHEILVLKDTDQAQEIIADLKDRASKLNVLTSAHSILRCAFSRFFPTRTAEYQLKSPLADHQYDKPMDTIPLSCSGLAASFFALHGIDIGKQFNKKPEEVSPADLDSSDFFKKIYSAG